MTTVYPIDPVRIYVLWHHASGDGHALAEAVHQWFRGSPSDVTEAGYGIQVHYRTGDLDKADGCLVPIRPDAADVTIIVPLVDEHMVTDPAWRGYLERLAGTQAKIYTVVLHPSAFNLPERLAALNFIRIDRSSDPDHSLKGTISDKRELFVIDPFSGPRSPNTLMSASRIDTVPSPIRQPDSDRCAT